MKKFLISDYDGTFYLNDEDIIKNIKKVNEFRKKGNIFAIATGRSFLDFTKKLEQFDIQYDYLTINHGATILNKKHEIIKNYPISNNIKEVIKNEFNLIDNHNIFVCKSLESRVSIKEKDITKINIKFKNKEEQIKFNNILNTKYKKYIKSYLILEIENSIEIISSDTNKANAADIISKIEKISKENIYAIGDSYNDLEMLEKFNGICMQNSKPEIKEKIKRKCHTVSEVIEDLIDK